MFGYCPLMLNPYTLRPRQIGRHFPDDISNANPKGPIKIFPALVQIMAYRRPGDKPLSEPMIA